MKLYARRYNQILKRDFLKNVEKISKYFHNELNKIKNDYKELIKEVRGVGLLIGLQLTTGEVSVKP